MPQEIESLIGIKKRFGKKIICDGINFTILVGKFYLIKGLNGSGKTTFLRIIAGLSLPDEGRRIISKDFNKEGLFGFAFDNLPDMRFTAFEYLYSMGRISAIEKNELNRRIKEYAELLGFEDFLDTYISNLSKGSKQKISIVQAILKSPTVLIMDEPFSGLDERSKGVIIDILKDYKSQGGTLVIVSHEDNLLNEMVDEVHYLYNGKLYNEKDNQLFFKNKMKIVATGKISEYGNTERKLRDFSEVFVKGDLVEIFVQKQDTNKVLSQLIEDGFQIEYVGNNLIGDDKLR